MRGMYSREIWSIIMVIIKSFLTPFNALHRNSKFEQKNTKNARYLKMA